MPPSPAPLSCPFPTASVATEEEKRQVVPAKNSPCLSLATVLAAETGNAELISRSGAGTGKVVFIKVAQGSRPCPSLSCNPTSPQPESSSPSGKIWKRAPLHCQTAASPGTAHPISSETNNPELHAFLGHSHLLQQLELEFPWQDK